MEVIVDTNKGVYKERIVRCKECNAWNGEDDFGRCDVHLIGTYADDFCSYGVKKGADDEASD